MPIYRMAGYTQAANDARWYLIFLAAGYDLRLQPAW